MRQIIPIYILVICLLILGCQPALNPIPTPTPTLTQITTPTSLPTPTPTSTPLAIPITPIAAGSGHTCALTANGGVKCWGRNDRGQLGDGTTTDRLTPVDVIGLASDIRAIVAGEYFTCALTSAGGVKCWGGNHFALGDGTTIDRHTPVDVSGLAGGVQGIRAAGRHACAVTTSGQVQCWGEGCLGNGSCEGSGTPVQVSGLTSGVTAVAAGLAHICAVTSNGGAKCWGINSGGELGNGATTSATTPVDVMGLTGGVVAIAPADYHTCALTTERGVKCWGAGFDNVTYEIYPPTDVLGLTSDVQAISSGGSITCALTMEGGVKCWSPAEFSRVLDAGTALPGVPTRPFDFFDYNMPGLESGNIAVAVGNHHICVVTLNDEVKCLGTNDYGQLGDGTRESHSGPVLVMHR